MQSPSKRALLLATAAFLVACGLALPNESNAKATVTNSEVVAPAAPAASRRAPRLDERKFKYEADPKKELTQFMNTKNLVKTLVKLVFGSDEESAATSR